MIKVTKFYTWFLLIFLINIRTLHSSPQTKNKNKNVNENNKRSSNDMTESLVYLSFKRKVTKSPSQSLCMLRSDIDKEISKRIKTTLSVETVSHPFYADFDASCTSSSPMSQSISDPLEHAKDNDSFLDDIINHLDSDSFPCDCDSSSTHAKDNDSFLDDILEHLDSDSFPCDCDSSSSHAKDNDSFLDGIINHLDSDSFPCDSNTRNLLENSATVAPSLSLTNQFQFPVASFPFSSHCQSILYPFEHAKDNDKFLDDLIDHFDYNSQTNQLQLLNSSSSYYRSISYSSESVSGNERCHFDSNLFSNRSITEDVNEDV